MSDLASWLLEQIAEDEADLTEPTSSDYCDDLSGKHYSNERVRAECEAKRRIIERVPAVIKHYAPFEREWEWCPKARTEPWGDLSWGSEAECECGADEENAHGGNWFLRVLALPYADRPGYREEWRP